MPKLILKFENRVLQEIVLGSEDVHIGRLPDNTVAIDNPAVSGRHARVACGSGSYVLMDLKSTNGTFVNEQLITEHTLRNGDVVLVGKHQLVFVDAEDTEAATPLADPGGTLFLDTKAQKERLAKAVAPPGAPQAPAATAEPARLSVLSGRAERPEYVLKGHTSVIGKSDSALIRLRGWFTPQVAAVIARKGDEYVVTPVSGKPQVNGVPMKERQPLRDGDVLLVSGLTLQFTQKR